MIILLIIQMATICLDGMIQVHHTKLGYDTLCIFIIQAFYLATSPVAVSFFRKK